LAIRHLVAAYSDGVNRNDRELWASTWTEDCHWSLPGAGTFKGKEEALGFFDNALSSTDFVVQLLYQGTIEVDGNKASGRWYLCEHLRFKGQANGMFNIASYKDGYVKENNKWLIASRDYHVLYNDEGKGDMSGMVIPFPAGTA